MCRIQASALRAQFMLLDKKLSFPNKGQKHRWDELGGASASLTIARAATQYDGFVVALVADPLSADKLDRELKVYLPESYPGEILHFPDWETLPYDHFSPHQDIISERLLALHRLMRSNRGILIVPIATCMQRVCPKEFLVEHAFTLNKGETLDLTAYRAQLEKVGYQYTHQVMEHGEFTVRGALLDLFPMGSDHPFRIELFDNEVDSIRTFDPQTQLSKEKVNHVELLPAHEFALTDESITDFRNRWRETFEGDPSKCSVYVDVSEGLSSHGIEYYAPLFYDSMASLIDYFPDNALLITMDKLDELADQFWNGVAERYEQYRYDITRPILDPKALFIPPNEFFGLLKPFSRILVVEPKRAIPDIALDPKKQNPLALFQAWQQSFEGRVLLCAESTGRLEIIKELLDPHKVSYTEINSWEDFLTHQNPLCITVAPIDRGMHLHASGLAVVAESELFGKRVAQRRRRKSHGPDPDLLVRNLVELQVGCFVVHLEHGIGRYLGLTSFQKDQEEFLILEYDGGDKLYVPVRCLDVIHRYSGAENDKAPLHRLGSGQWEKARKKAAEQIRDVAAELLEIYAKRQAKPGIAYPKPSGDYESFALDFPFEETPDQQKAIEDVLNDLTSPNPTDRVICGDVGFGKTEVAMRAAFVVVEAKKQVAVLVPTTLLAEQHYHTFRDRFSQWPISIEAISRFRTKKEQEDILKRLTEGKIDILIGTHKLLSSDVKFKDLGLMILDEEHRFGVRQKEKLKALRAEVDILTMTATPIPRTLNMAMAGIRDLSIIATPPLKRLSVKTFVREYHKPLIKEGITRELRRGGQVFYLHNSVDTIDNAARTIEEIVPSARVVVAHGQMRERELERVMSDFYHRRYNVLVCTTIIETGIDIPTANTLFIDRADKFGLAQLHQLRGRVGRSHHQAYAFLMTPPHKKMTKQALQRLEAIEGLDTLGVGFRLAMHDMEIRGAGELLGDKQSGDIQSVGFSLYMEMLDKAVKALKAGKTLDVDHTLESSIDVDLHVPALIPEKYIPDVPTRVILYKRIANGKTETELDHLKVEMIDRFGLLPEPTKRLFEIARLKLICQKLGVSKISWGKEMGSVEFVENPKIDPIKLITLVQKSPDKYQFQGSTKIRVKGEYLEPTARIEAVEQFLSLLV